MSIMEHIKRDWTHYFKFQVFYLLAYFVFGLFLSFLNAELPMVILGFVILVFATLNGYAEGLRKGSDRVLDLLTSLNEDDKK